MMKTKPVELEIKFSLLEHELIAHQLGEMLQFTGSILRDKRNSREARQAFYKLYKAIIKVTYAMEEIAHKHYDGNSLPWWWQYGLRDVSESSMAATRL